ncbi:MAG: hypothetical protein O6831_12810 [Alphaproteobacteria bacterium]|nr:hypothetical protein [Alphaproteobacteria bacterium]
MVRIFMLSAIAAVLMAVPAKAGSPDFTLSLYTCSDVYLGGEKVGDNCLETDEEKLADMESTVVDGEGEDDE